MELRIPDDVASVVAKLNSAGHDAYVVGGCVRDAIRGVEPQDWDVATDATPPEIQSIFRRSLYTNRFGTVVVRAGDREIEVTTYRLEAEYSDHRRPDSVAFTDSLHADLSRRDFTMNAMAWRPAPRSADPAGPGTAPGELGVPPGELGVPPGELGVPPGELVDPYGGKDDLDGRLVRAVGVPDERFREDALRMLRAVRFATVLGFTIEAGTAAAIERDAELARGLSGERVQQEMTKILTAERPSVGIRLLSDVGLLRVLLPELEECKAIPQDKAVAQDVFEHSLVTVDATRPDDLVLRLAALFHDIGKPRTFADGHFHQHEIVGAHVARDILRRWKLPKETIAEVTHLIRHHMFWYQEEWSGAAVRRFIRNVGLENIPALFELRRADNVGSGARSPRMYALDALWLRVQEEIQRATAFSTRDLAVDGSDVMAELGIPEGPEVGRIIRELFERVTDNPDLNTRESLLSEARKIHRAER